MFEIPHHWKSKRQIILELYFVERSAAKVAVILNRDQRYVRRVIHDYRAYLQKRAVQSPQDRDIS